MPPLSEMLAQLGVNVPVYCTRVVGGRIELHLYGGRIVVWLPEQPGLEPGQAAASPSSAGVEPPHSAPAREEPAVSGLPTEPPPTTRRRRKARP